MFLYELHRQTEQERLFQGQMFELAREKGSRGAHESRMNAIEYQLSTLSKLARSKDVEEQAATSKLRLDGQQAKINEQSVRMNDFDQYLRSLQERVDDLENGNGLHQRLVNSQAATLKTQTDSLEAISTKLDELHASSSDRDAQVACMQQQVHRLEENEQRAMEMFGLQHHSIQAAHQSIEAVKSSFESSCTRDVKDFNLANARLTVSVHEVETSTEHLTDEMRELADGVKVLKTEYEAGLAHVNEIREACTFAQDTAIALNEDIGVLFDERDILIANLNAACMRIDKLEGTVRAMTGQAISPISSTALNSPQVLPVRDSSGRMMDLKVAKGGSVTRYHRFEGEKKDA